VNPNCYACGKFVPWSSHVTWVSYGSQYDTEPPDPEFMHIKCWESDEMRRDSISRVAWLGPMVVES